MGGAKEFDIILRGVYMDDNFVGSKRLEGYRKRLEGYRKKAERNRKNQARSSRKSVASRQSHVAQFPHAIQHFFHPSCPLFHDPMTRIFLCGACHKNFHDYSYRCEACDFDMDVECAQVSPGQGMIPHFSHRHPLKVLSDEEHVMEGECDGSCCEICREVFGFGGGGTTCACEECHFYIHKSCMDVLPREIKHFFHGSKCPLVFHTRQRYKCEACDEEGSGLCFFCRKCDFSMCVECSLLPTVSSRTSDAEIKKKIQHFLHSHTLTLLENHPRDVSSETSCSACGNHSLDPTYACSNCNFFLHKSCAELPREIRSPFHLAHPLLLKQVANSHLDSQNSRCILCLKDCQEYFAYCCEECNVLLDVECSFLKPTIEYQRHNHLLTVVESIHVKEFKCCDKSRIGFPVFRCVECNYNLHLLCGPLPLSVKHQCHIHPLKLLDYFVEDDRHDYCCHACEMPRDPELCAYHCSDCQFIADVKCILSQILLSLKGANGDVKLRTIARRIPSKLVIGRDLTLKKTENYGSFTDAREDNMIMRRTQSSSSILKYFNMREVYDYSIDNVDGNLVCNLKFRGRTNLRIQETTFSYSNECFSQLGKRLKSNSLLWDVQLQNFVEEHKKFVPFKSNLFPEILFPETLIPTLEILLEKHGDVSIRSKAKSLNIKSVYFYLLCCVLESMNTTKLLEVTEDHLSNWHACLYKVKNAGFEVQVIYDHVDHVVHAYFGLQAQKFKDETANQLKGKINSISEEIDRLSRELEETKKKLSDHEKFVKKGTTSLIKQCLHDASKMKYIYAASGLL